MNKIALSLGINGSMHILEDDKDKVFIEFKLTKDGDRYTNGLISIRITNNSEYKHTVSVKVENSLSNTVENVGEAVIEADSFEDIPIIDVTRYFSSAYTELSESGIDIIGVNVLVLDFDDGNDVKRVSFDERQLLKDFEIVPNK